MGGTQNLSSRETVGKQLLGEEGKFYIWILAVKPTICINPCIGLISSNCHAYQTLNIVHRKNISCIESMA